MIGPARLMLHCARCDVGTSGTRPWRLTETDKDAQTHRYRCETCGQMHWMTVENALDLPTPSPRMTDPNARIGAYADATGRELPDGTDTFQHLQKPDLHPAGDPLAMFVKARIIDLELEPRHEFPRVLRARSRADRAPVREAHAGGLCCVQADRGAVPRRDAEPQRCLRRGAWLGASPVGSCQQVGGPPGVPRRMEAGVSKPYTVDDVIRDLRRGLLIAVVALLIGFTIWLVRVW